jgi:hypothetical protein
MGPHWWSIEVRDGEFSAARWRYAHGERLIEAAITHGAREWTWTPTPWGVIFEVAFAEPSDWARFRALPAVGAALDAVPDPVNGLYVYPGRGGSTGSRDRRRPGPKPAVGGAPLPVEPEPVIVVGHHHTTVPPSISGAA